MLTGDKSNKERAAAAKTATTIKDLRAEMKDLKTDNAEKAALIEKLQKQMVKAGLEPEK